MPISVIGSYPPTMQEFLVHWGAVNEAMGATPLLLKGQYTMAQFAADRAAIVAAIDAVEVADNGRQLASADRDARKETIRTRAGQFRALVKGLLSGTRYESGLPTLPGISAIESRFLRPLVDIAELWSRINADTSIPNFVPPLVLNGSYTLDHFRDDLVALRAAFLTSTTATMRAQTTRDARDVLLKPAQERMKQYRTLVGARLDPAHPLQQSVPVLTPAEGSTPDPVVASGAWNEARGRAELTWTASSDANLDHYSIRTSAGPSYKVRDERALGTVPAGTETFSTADGLAAPGAEAMFKVYVVTGSLNEKGSNTVKVTRP